MPISQYNHRKITVYWHWPMSEIRRAKIKNHTSYQETKDDKVIFNENFFYGSEAVRRYHALKLPRLLHILAALLVYPAIFLSIQFIPWVVQYLQFSNDAEIGKFLVYGLPAPLLVALVIILRS